MLDTDIRAAKKSIQKQWLRNGGGRPSGDVTLNMRLRYALIFLTAIAVVTVHHVQKEFFGPRLDAMVIYENYYLEERDPQVTCQFPILHPFDESILAHVKIASPIRCFARQKELTMMDLDGFLCYNKSGLIDAGYNENSPPDCFYQEITRVDGSDFDVVYSSPVKMSGYDKPQSDFVYVECQNFAGINTYKNFHAYVQRNLTVRKYKDDKELSVAVIGLDSMSRLNFMRQLPDSYRFIINEMGGVVLLGFNKVGENTFPNLVPMLTGRPSAWWPSDQYKNWPFVWSQFEAEGAATMYSEDLPDFNMFDYMSTGLRDQPTLHYMRTYWLAVERSMFYHMSSTYCLGPRPKHLIYFEYLRSFLRVYRDSPSFLFSLFNEASHDYVNTVGAIDEDLRDFLNSSLEEGLFDRTIVLILGDHGNRIDPIRLTDVGRIEDRMPMVSVVMPSRVDQYYPSWRKAVQENSKRLLSSYDIHGTFLDILSTLKSPGSEDIQSVFNFNNLKKSGLDTRWAEHFSKKSPEVSFFRPVPVARGCKDAGIPDWFCVCQTNQEKLEGNDRRSLRAAETIVQHFNTDILHGLTQKCAEQQLTTVESAILTKHNDPSADKGYRVQVMFRTSPGDGVFEATVDFHTVDGKEMGEVVGELLRINRYGSQADCLPAAMRANSTILRGVCYCK